MDQYPLPCPLIFDNYLLAPTKHAGHQYGDHYENQNNARDAFEPLRKIIVTFRPSFWHPHHADMSARLTQFQTTIAASSVPQDLSFCISLSASFLVHDTFYACLLSVSKAVYVALATSIHSLQYRTQMAMFRGTALATRHVGLPFSLGASGFEQKMLARSQTRFEKTAFLTTDSELEEAHTNVEAGRLECEDAYCAWEDEWSSSLPQHQIQKQFAPKNWLFLAQRCPWILSIEETYQGGGDSHTVSALYDYNTISVYLSHEECYDEGVCNCDAHEFVHYKSCGCPDCDCNNSGSDCSDSDCEEEEEDGCPICNVQGDNVGDVPGDESIVLWHRDIL